jgi:uncharacterized glyoxalase superfamily protein PhnB
MNARPAFICALVYRDPFAALEWLERAFGFERAMVITDPAGKAAHLEMRFGDGTIMIASEWAGFLKSPAALDGKNTQSVHVHLQEDVDAHCRRAKGAGGEILMEPEDQFYGDRSYRVRDLEGHVWTFSQSVRAVSIDEMEKASGLKIAVYEH